MTLDDIKNARQYLEPDDLVIITTDNQHLEYDQALKHIPIMWDDENEMMLIIKESADTNHQQITPITLCCLSYDIIQRFEIAKNTKSAINLVNKLSATGLMDEKTKTIAMEKISRASSNKDVDVKMY